MPSNRDLFENFERMRREIDELFGDIFSRTGVSVPGARFAPPVDVLYLDDPPRAVVKAELAGVEPADLALEVDGREVVIAGRRRSSEPAGAAFQQIEIEHGPFRRVVRLTAPVDAAAAQAVYEHGILRIELPLAASGPRARTVPIESSSSGTEQA